MRGHYSTFYISCCTGYHVVMCVYLKENANYERKIELETIGASAIVLKCIGPSSEFAVAETDGNLMEKGNH